MGGLALIGHWIAVNSSSVSTSSPPTPPTAPLAPGPGLVVSSDPSWIYTVLVPFVAASLGAAFTLLGEWRYRYIDDRRAGKRLEGSVFRELEKISAIANEHSAAKGVVRLSAPLPTIAWRTLTSSGHADKLSDIQLAAVMGAYSAVDDANFKASMVPLLTQITALASDEDVIREYRDEIFRLSTVPYVDVASRAAAAVGALSSTPRRTAALLADTKKLSVGTENGGSR